VQQDSWEAADLCLHSPSSKPGFPDRLDRDDLEVSSPGGNPCVGRSGPLFCPVSWNKMPMS